MTDYVNQRQIHYDYSDKYEAIITTLRLADGPRVYDVEMECPANQVDVPDFRAYPAVASVKAGLGEHEFAVTVACDPREPNELSTISRCERCGVRAAASRIRGLSVQVRPGASSAGSSESRAQARWKSAGESRRS